MEKVPLSVNSSSDDTHPYPSQIVFRVRAWDFCQTIKSLYRVTARPKPYTLIRNLIKRHFNARLGIQFHGDGFLERVMPNDGGLAHFGGDALAHPGHFGFHRFIELALVSEAAHQATAGAGNLHRVQGQILLLSHLDRDRRKLR